MWENKTNSEAPKRARHSGVCPVVGFIARGNLEIALFFVVLSKLKTITSAPAANNYHQVATITGGEAKNRRAQQSLRCVIIGVICSKNEFSVAAIYYTVLKSDRSSNLI